MPLYLDNSTQFEWHRVHHITTCGYAYEQSDLLQGRRLAERFANLDTFRQWHDLLGNLSGVFLVISETDDYLRAAVDPVRSLPLFYTYHQNQWHLSNKAVQLRKDLKLTDIAYGEAAEYLLTGYVTGAETLFPEIKQIQAGEIVELPASTSEAKSKRYFRFTQKPDADLTSSELIQQLHETHLDIFEDLIESMNGRTAVIPLSGGFDSRLIACMLERLDYAPIQYFTYGSPGNWESKIAREITQHFNRNLIFIPYRKQTEYQSFQSEERKAYSLEYGNLSSHSHLQDFRAIKKLKEDQLIPDDSIIIPGHSGGLMAGMHTPDQFVGESEVSQKSLVDYLLDKNYNRFKWDSDELSSYFYHKVSELLNLSESMTGKQAVSTYEEWIWQERQAKYIVNSLRVYDFWGYEWRIPLLDRKLMDYWATVPVAKRSHRLLYNDYINDFFNLPVTPANSKKFHKLNQAINPFTDERYGRFIGDFGMMNLLFKWVNDVVNIQDLDFPFLNGKKLLWLEKPSAISSLYFIKEILAVTDARIKKT